MLSYVSHEILNGKPELKGLPATFGTEEDCMTLKLVCEDKYVGMQVELLYTVFQDVDVITRSVRVTNVSQESFYLTKVYSACIDMDNKDFDMVSLHGSWARERHIQRKTLGYGIQNVSSFRGESSHQDHPFLALVDKNTTQENGEIYAMNFVYSGNFRAQAEVTQFDFVRMTMGIHPENFCWKLECGESFQAPEVVMVYTDKGFDAMTSTFPLNLLLIYCPIAKRAIVRMTFAKPAIVHNQHFNTKFRCFFCNRQQFFCVKLKIGNRVETTVCAGFVKTGSSRLYL